MIYVLPLLFFVIPLIGGVLLVRHGRWVSVWVLAAVALAGFAWALWQGNKLQGWDAVGYAIFALLMMAPAGLGVLAGGALGWWLARRRGNGNGNGP